MDYNYYDAMEQDIRDYIEDNLEYVVEEGMDLDDLQEKLYDEMFMADSVTGNASGSYTFNAYKAEENLAHNLDLLQEAYDEFGDDYGDLINRGAETADVIIRCYLLGQVLGDYFIEHEDELQAALDEVNAVEEDEDEEDEI